MALFPAMFFLCGPIVTNHTPPYSAGLGRTGTYIAIDMGISQVGIPRTLLIIANYLHPIV